jgi:hypothetical protein
MISGVRKNGCGCNVTCPDGTEGAPCRAHRLGPVEVEAAERRDPSRNGAGRSSTEAQLAGLSAPTPVRAASTPGSAATLRVCREFQGAFVPRARGGKITEPSEAVAMIGAVRSRGPAGSRT